MCPITPRLIILQNYRPAFEIYFTKTCIVPKQKRGHRDLYRKVHGKNPSLLHSINFGSVLLFTLFFVPAYNFQWWIIYFQRLKLVQIHMPLLLISDIWYLRWKVNFYRTRVRSLVMLVSNSLTHSLTYSLPFSKLESDHCLPLSLTHWLTFLS